MLFPTAQESRGEMITGGVFMNAMPFTTQTRRFPPPTSYLLPADLAMLRAVRAAAAPEPDQGSLLEALRELRSSWLVDKRALCDRVAMALGWLMMQMPHGRDRALIERVENTLCAGRTPELAEILDIEDQLRGPVSRARTCGVVEHKGRLLAVAVSHDNMVTIGHLAEPRCILLDRGRWSPRGHLVEAGGSPHLSREDYEAIETALRGWL